MNPLVREWVEKAEGDFVTAGRELRARKSPNYDAACFHAQQCAEKYLKAILQISNIPFGRTHNLPALLDLVTADRERLEPFRPMLSRLGEYSVHVRYPGETADRESAKEAYVIRRDLREQARIVLRISSGKAGKK
ncbi:MAG: HEPN domain-containing protein [Nitrospinae bacterium]|nr:HEPN domain-containing protein [Nitrospinota bacterium]